MQDFKQYINEGRYNNLLTITGEKTFTVQFSDGPGDIVLSVEDLRKLPMIFKNFAGKSGSNTFESIKTMLAAFKKKSKDFTYSVKS